MNSFIFKCPICGYPQYRGVFVDERIPIDFKPYYIDEKFNHVCQGCGVSKHTDVWWAEEQKQFKVWKESLMLKQCECGYWFVNDEGQYNRFNLMLDEEAGTWGLICSGCGKVYTAPFKKGEI